MDIKKLISGSKKGQPGENPRDKRLPHVSGTTDALWAILRRQRSEILELQAIVGILKRDVARLDKYFYKNKERIIGGDGEDLAKANLVVGGNFPPGQGPTTPGLGEETLDALPMF